MTTDSDLTKLHVDLPNHWATGGEALWARPLGDDLYAIENVPFHIYGLNYGDVVRATADDPTLKPEIREVVRPSGHQTIRLFFQDETPAPDRLAFVTSLRDFGVTFEGKDGSLFALDIPPNGRYGALYDHLQEQEGKAFWAFETCEARRPGSFDDTPEESPDERSDAS